MSSRLLQVYIDDDGHVWAEDKANGVAYRLQHAVGTTDYPSPPPEPAPPEAQDASVSLTNQLFSAELVIDPLGGDVMAKAIVGPNAGKFVNLTYGRWLEPR